MEDKAPTIDAITKPSVQAGGRSMFVLDIETDWIDQNNKLRLETAVEDQKYVKDDLTLDLTSENLNGKFEGTGYIRYVRIIPQN